jgi:hypothetical protein
MKNIQTLLGAVLCGVLLGVAGNVSAQPAKSCYATVVRVEGVVSYSLDNNAWFPLVPGKYLPPGSSIRTGHNGVVDIVLGHAVELPQATWAPERISPSLDSPVRGWISYKPTSEQNAVRLTPETILSIDKLTTTDTGADTVSDTEINLKKGKIYASVKKLSAASQYLVKTPTGIAGVRGTQFCIALNEDGSIKTLEVYNTTGDDGLLLSVTFPGGTTKTWIINQGQSFDQSTGQLSPIPPGVIGALHQIFDALRTPYVGVMGFDYDRTRTCVSNNYGTPNSDGSGGGGGGGGGSSGP